MERNDTTLQILTKEQKHATQAKIQYTDGLVIGYMAVDKVCIKGDLSNINEEELKKLENDGIKLCTP